MKECFFYGLYMDVELLKYLGFNPNSAHTAVLEGYALDLRGSAKVIPRQGNQVWGMLIKLPPADLQAMYSFETTRHYTPEQVAVNLPDGEQVQACCYNLPASNDEPLNLEYRDKLLVVIHKLGFPDEYIGMLEGLHR